MMNSDSLAHSSTSFGAILVGITLAWGLGTRLRLLLSWEEPGIGNGKAKRKQSCCSEFRHLCWAMSQEGAGDELNRSQSKTESARDQIFNQFFEVTDFQEIQKSFRTLCDAIEASECEGLALYASLKRELTSWKCRQLWKLLDERASLPEYADQKACEEMSVLVVGGGPVGLRAAIEAALLGARVDLVEKRTSFSRNNSLHLWPFLITDLRALGAKKFYGKFCAGAIDHICKSCITARMLMNLPSCCKLDGRQGVPWYSHQTIYSQRIRVNIVQNVPRFIAS